jgi:hypothetical protein
MPVCGVLTSVRIGYCVLWPLDTELFFVGRADGLEIKDTRTHGYRDIELIFNLRAGADTGYAKFCYEESDYRPCGQRTVHNFD